jgi:ligand-binding sensor domain-containing protein
MAATEEGVLRLAPGGVERVDTQGVGTGRYMAVGCVGADVYAGGLEGLYRFSGSRGEHLGVASGFDAGWVTALTVHEGRLVVGTYANGVYELRGEAFTRVRGLERQWVTPHGLESIAGTLWVGGLGMPAKAGEAPLEAPARDTFDFVATPSVIYVLTSQGVMTSVRLPNI